MAAKTGSLSRYLLSLKHTKHQHAGTKRNTQTTTDAWYSL